MIRSFYPYKNQVLAYTSSKVTAVVVTKVLTTFGLKAKWKVKPRKHGGNRYPYEIAIARKSGKDT